MPAGSAPRSTDCPDARDLPEDEQERPDEKRPPAKGPVVVVVGGGVSGLSAARRLACQASVGAGRPAGAIRRPPIRVVVLEASSRLGGKVVSGELEGRPIDLGPDNFLVRDPIAERLCDSLGLGDLITAPATGAASLLNRGRLVPLPGGLVLGVPTDLAALARSGVLSSRGVARASLDLLGAAPPPSDAALGLALDQAGDGAEWSAASILGHYLGREVVARLVDPLLGGINAGVTTQLSLAVVAPQIARALSGRRSAIRALAPIPPPAARSYPNNHAGSALSPFRGLKGGLGQMISALSNDLARSGVELRTDCAVASIRCVRPPSGSGRASTLETDRQGGTGPASQHYVLETSSGPVRADALVLAVPAYAAARLLVDVAPGAARELGAVPYSSVSLLTTTWESGSLPSLPAGSGFLVGPTERRLVTGCTVMSAKWPETAGRGRTVLRASTGRFGDLRAAEMSDEEVTRAVIQELREIVGATGQPKSVLVQRWPRAFPQYLPGHLARVRRARSSLDSSGPIELAGAMLGGIGIPACISSGEAAAVAVLAHLKR